MGNKIAVIGSGGRLGSFVVDTAIRQDFSVTAIAQKKRDDWPDSVTHVYHSSRSDYSGLRELFDIVDTVVIAAGLTSTDLHELALESGCHVIDVGVSESTVRRCLTLDGRARSKNRCLVTMAGLAPGLIGLLAVHMANQNPAAESIDICLVQNAAGTAGTQGTIDMLDMLTDRDLSPMVDCCIGEKTGSVRRTRAFTFPTVEQVFLTTEPPALYKTTFNRGSFNALLRVLRSIRVISPSLYSLIRDKTAAQKTAATQAGDERILLSAVATAKDGSTAGVTTRSYKSDYGATAAVALTLARLAGCNMLSAGAGPPHFFTSWDEVANSAIVRGEETGS